MKRLLIVFTLFLLPSLACAGSVQDALRGVIAMKNAVAPSGDDCSGDMVASFHFEDTATNNTTVGTPAGCVASGLTATYSLTGGSTYETGAGLFSDGATSVKALGEDDAVEWTHGGADLTEVGTWCGDVRFNGTSNGRLMTINKTTTPILGIVAYNAGGNTIGVTYGGSTYTGTDTFANDTFTRLCLSWDESQGAGADKLAVKVGANSWQHQENYTLTDVAQDAVIDIIGGSNFQYHRAYSDNVKLYNVYEKVE